jgi:dephospho-CoA kinase
VVIGGERKFLLVGLTGGIATGKSTVSAMFRALGCLIIDADVLAREVVEPGQPAYEQIVAHFRRDVLHADGTLDRGALAQRVFAEPAERKRLEAITHPEIRARLATHLGDLVARGYDGIVIFDAPVMVESGNYRSMDRLVVVTADDGVQVSRQVSRDAATAEAARRRIASQMSLAEKVKLADYVIDNGGSLAATEEQVRRVHRALLDDLRARNTLGGGLRPPSDASPQE